MGDSLSCCVNRDSQDLELCGAGPQNLGHSAGLCGSEENLQFFDCMETEEFEEPLAHQRPKLRIMDWWNRRKLAGLTKESTPTASPRPKLRLFEFWINRRQRLVALRKGLRQPTEDSKEKLECTDCICRWDRLGSEAFSEENVTNVTCAVRQAWEDRIAAGGMDKDLSAKLAAEFPELDEWTHGKVVRRILRAACGHERDAIQMLIKAIESRVRDRELYRSQVCEVTCDMRVIGRDLENRPTLYVCFNSQSRPLRELRPQLFLAFEAAVKLVNSPDEQIVLIMDMTGFRACLNMDPCALRSFGESSGIFADRLHSVLIVDFSFLAQTMWATCKSLLSAKTQKKVNFVGERVARNIAREQFDAATCERILSAFTLNRDPAATPEKRALQAQRTAICDVPLGRPLPDKAG